jgi:hypothetical protein
MDDEGFVGFFVDITIDDAMSEAGTTVGVCFPSALD